MVTETTQILDKHGNALTDEEVKQKLQKILQDICFIHSIQTNIHSMFVQKCKEEFPGFESVTGAFYTTPKIVNVYFHAHEPINIVV